MNSTPGFSVGTYIIDSDTIYVITKIADNRVYYSPADITGHHPSVTGSIPLDNLISSGFRLLSTKPEIKQFFIDLKKVKPSSEAIDSKFYKDLRCLNSPLQIIPLLKQLWIGKNNPDIFFSGNNRDTLENILDHLSREFSLVLRQSPAVIRKKIIASLSQK